MDNPMPANVMVDSTVSDPSEHVEGWYGRAGGTFDADSGVLALEYVPYSKEELGEPNEETGPWEDYQYAQTTVRFVEVERLLVALSRLDRFSTDAPSDPEFWRAVLLEKLDAHRL